MARTDTLPHFLTDLADSIRQKTGETGKISPDNMDVVVKSIPSGDVSQYFADTSSSYWAQTFIKRMPPITLSSGYQSFKDFRQLEEMPVIKNCADITTFFGMFTNCYELKSIELDGTNSGSYYDAFNSCRKLTYINIKNFGKNKTANSIDCGSMFTNCFALTTIDFDLDFSKISAVGNMFNTCNAITDIQNIVNRFKNTSSLTGSCANMFANCSNLSGNVDLDFTNANNLSYMFAACPKLNRVNNLKNEKSTNFESMFKNCYALSYADLSGIKCSNVTKISSMFYNCSALTYIDIRNIRPTTGTFTYTDAFRGISKTCEIYINQELYNKLGTTLSSYTNVHIVPGYWE